MVDRQFVETVVKKYELSSIAETMLGALDALSIKIGFIGSFSSGKTTIVNALLGTSLPVDVKPTTKSICIIEPVPGLDSPRYFRDADGYREPVDFMTICDIINGDVNGDAVVQLPPSNVLHERMIFVDTPGIDSMGREEADLTYAYLSMMDAAVVCIPVDDGTVKKSVVDFICSPMLKPFASRLAFLLTKSDLKSPDAVNGIRSEVVRQLEDLCRDGRLPIGESEIEKRVLVVSREGAISESATFIDANFFKKLPQILAEREEKELRRIASEVSTILKARADMLCLDDDKYKKAIAEASATLGAIEEEESQKKKDLSALVDRLQTCVLDIMLSCKRAIACAQDADIRKAEIDKMIDLIRGEVTSFCQIHVKSFVPSPGIVAALDDSLNNALKDIERYRDLGVMVSTSIATAFICPGAGAAANAGEAAAGALGQQAAKAGAKAAAVRAARGAVKTVVKKPSLFSKALRGLATVIKEINPIETIGDIVAEKYKSSSFDATARASSWNIANRVVADLAEPYRREVIMPLRVRMEEVQRGIEELRLLWHRDVERLRKVHAEMLLDIEALQNYAKEQ